MEGVKPSHNYELISDQLSRISQQLLVLILQKGYDRIENELKKTEEIIKNNLDEGEITQDEFDVLMFELNRINENRFLNTGSKSNIPNPESK